MLFENRKKHHGNRPNHRVLRTEVLEERALLSAVPLSDGEYENIAAQYSNFNLPDTPADLNIITLDLSEGDDLSDLKSAIATAGTTTESDLIVIRTSETAKTLTYAAAADEITIAIDATQYGSITLVGLGSENLTLDANQLCRVMTVSGENTVANLGGMTITDGYRISHGGGIYVGTSSTLTLDDCLVDGNQTFGSSSYGGAGIYSRGNVTVQNSTISNNKATGDNYRGGGIYSSSGTLTVTNSTISGNTASASGGGILSGGTTELTDVTISGNTASDGGGIYSYGDLTVTNSTISENTASYGGGIYNSSSKLTITQSEIINNKATTNSNHSTYGGGIYNSGNGTATLTNVTIAGNIAQYTGTSTSYKGYGGGVYNTSGTFNAYNTIIAGNTANNGNDIYKNSGTINGYHSLSSYTAWGGANNVEYIPEGSLFRSIENGDFRLAPGSQASERGNNQYAYDVGMDETWLDMAGELRFIGDIIDIGAYESSRLDISQWGIYTGNVSLSWVQYKNAENLRLTWVSGTTATVLGLFDSAGEYTWDTTKYADGNGQLKIDYLDENGKVLLTSNIVATILNDANIAVHRGEISADETWNADKVHLVVGKTTVKSGATLVIAENAIVKFWKNAYLNTESGSTLTIQDNVILTRAEDDSIGGDTNKDGVLSVAKMGNAYLRGNGTFDLASTVEMRFVTQTTSGTLSQSETWLSGKVYHVTSTLTVPSGVTLTILPGAVVKFDSGCSLVVKSGGSLVAEGNATQPIIFTSVKDDSYGGDTNEDDGEYGPEAGDWKQIWSTVVVRYSIMQSYDMRGMFLDHKAQFTAVMLRA